MGVKDVIDVKDVVDVVVTPPAESEEKKNLKKLNFNGNANRSKGIRAQLASPINTQLKTSGSK